MICPRCHSGYRGRPYRITATVHSGGKDVGYLDEKFCSEKCGIEFANEFSVVIGENIMTQRDDENAS